MKLQAAFLLPYPITRHEGGRPIADAIAGMIEKTL